MTIVDNALKKRAAEGRPIRVGVIGSGFMGRGLANQIINSVPGMRLVAAAGVLRRHPARYRTRPIPDAETLRVRGLMDALIGTLAQTRLAPRSLQPRRSRVGDGYPSG